MRKDARLCPSQLLQQRQSQGLINKTLFLPVLGGRKQKKANYLRTLTRASTPSWAPPSRPQPLPNASSSNAIALGEGFQHITLGGLGTDVQTGTAGAKPLRSTPKSNEMIKDCKQLLSSEGPSRMRGRLGSGLSERPPAKLAQTFTWPESLDSGGPAAAQRKRQNSNSIIE